MNKANVPTADSITFDSYEESIKFLTGKTPPFVIKANGLAAGKGVTIATSHEEAYEALDNCLNKEIFGESGKTVLIEEFLEGKELSIFSFTDGYYVSPLVAACDYKRIYDNDLGPNTGGMGAYSPAPIVDEETRNNIMKDIVEPVFAVIGAAIVVLVYPILPYALSFAAGAMIFIVVEEVIPESQKGGNTDLATMGLIVGFIVMMCLDVALG